MNIKEKAAKHIKVISLIIGFAYSGFAALSLMMVFLQKLMMSNFGPPPDEHFMNTMNTIHDIYIIYMPIAIILGICYILFGSKVRKLKSKLYQANLILRIISAILPIAYSIHSLKFLKLFSDGIPGGPGDFSFIAYIMGIFGFIIVIAVFTVPQFFINKKVKVYLETNAT